MFIDRPARAVFLLVAALVPTVAGGEEQPTLEVTVPNTSVSVGDRVSVRVAARGGEDWMWGELQVRVQEMGPWAVVEGPRPVAGSRPPAWEVVLAPLALGEIELPEMAATVRPPDGEPQAIELAAPPSIEVASILPPDQDVEPAPLRDPIGVRGFPWEWVLPVVAGVAPLVLALVWWLRRRRGAVAHDQTLDLPPLDQLIALLGELEPRIGVEPAPGICDRLASGFRRYVERRSGEPALEMTSFELRVLARREKWPEAVQREMHGVTEVVDGVRFGRRHVIDADLREAVGAAGDAARRLEEHLRALEEPVEATP